MLGKLFGRSAERPAADPHALPVPRRQKNGMYTLRALGDTRVLALVEAADSGEWEAVKAALGPFDLGRDHQVLGQLADLDGVQDWIGRAAEEDKEHRATALLISGARHISWGWEARTADRAVNVTQEQWRIFHQRLHIAEEQLLEAAELRPEWITPWRRLLTSGRGMSLGPAVNETRRDAALRRDPLDLETRIEWVSYLQPRWSGEPGQALAFAREAFAACTRGTPSRLCDRHGPHRELGGVGQQELPRNPRDPGRVAGSGRAQHPPPRLRAFPGLAGGLQHLRHGDVTGLLAQRVAPRLRAAPRRLHAMALEVHGAAGRNVRPRPAQRLIQPPHRRSSLTSHRTAR